MNAQVSFSAADSSALRSDSSWQMTSKDNSLSVDNAQNIAVKSYYKELKKFLKGESGGKHRQFADCQKCETKAKNPKLVAVHVCQCFFCFKVFAHSKYLVKHIIRRHPDGLQDLNMQLHSKSPGTQEQSALKAFENELKDLKNTFDERWSEVTKYLEPFKSIDIEKLQERSMHHSEVHRSTRRSKEQIQEHEMKVCDCASVKNSVIDSENRTKKLVETNEKAVQVLEDKFELNEKHVDQLSSECSAIRNLMNQSSNDINLLKTKTEEIVFTNKEVRDKVMELENRIDILNKKHVADYQELCNKMEEADSRPDNQDIERFLEQYLREYVRKIGLRKSLSSKEPSHRQRNSGHSQVKNIAQSVDEIPKKQESCLAEFVVDVDKESLHDHLQDIVDSNIYDLGIDSSNFKLTDAEYDMKFRLMRSKAQHISNIYKNFWEIHDDIQRVVNREVLSLIEKQKTQPDIANNFRNGDGPITTSKVIDSNPRKLSGDETAVPTITITQPSGLTSEETVESSGSCSSPDEVSYSSENDDDKKRPGLHHGDDTHMRTRTESQHVETLHSRETAKNVTDTQLSCQGDLCYLANASMLKSVDSTSSLQSLSSWDGEDI